MESIRSLQLEGRITVVGLAKNEEEIFFSGDTESFKLPMNSESMKLIRYIRDEVHRFGITFHRNKRSKGTFSNKLEEIKGIGGNTATLLLQKFRSLKNISDQQEESLAKIIGDKKAKIIFKHFHK